jgi:hypothetical protein
MPQTQQNNIPRLNAAAETMGETAHSQSEISIVVKWRL